MILVPWYIKAWQWWKRYWKWVLFPIGILVAVVTIATLVTERQNAVIPGDLDEETQEALRRLRTAEIHRNRQIEQLERQKLEQLKQLNEDQVKELEQLQKADTEEVVEWFNRL